MKTILIAAIALFLISGCKNEELEKQNADLQSQNKQLAQDISSRDEYIENVTQEINDVYSNLENVRSHEKALVNETNAMEGTKKLSSKEVREKLLTQIALIDTELQNNKHTISSLQKKVDSYKTQYAGLKKMIANLKETIDQREQSITELNNKVQGLEASVAEKSRQVEERDSLITQQNSVIDTQHKEIVTGFYVIGKRSELEEKGIIKKEGGFLWGLLGSTTTLASGVNPQYFNPINKSEETTINVKGKIDEILPKRNVEFYSQRAVNQDESILSISQPKDFWQENYLVIITD